MSSKQQKWRKNLLEALKDLEEVNERSPYTPPT